MGSAPSGPAPGRVDRRTARRQGTKDEIFAAAWDVVRQHGLAGLAMRDLGERVGMRAQSIYSYFASKNEIYDAMFHEGYVAFVAAMAATSETPPTATILYSPPASRRAASHTASVDFCTSDPVRYQLLFQRTIPDSTPSTASYAVALEALDTAKVALARIGITDPDAIDLWTAVFTGITDQQISNDPGGDRWRRLVDPAVDMSCTRTPRIPSPTRKEPTMTDTVRTVASGPLTHDARRCTSRPPSSNAPSTCSAHSSPPTGRLRPTALPGTYAACTCTSSVPARRGASMKENAHQMRASAKARQKLEGGPLEANLRRCRCTTAGRSRPRRARRQAGRRAPVTVRKRTKMPALMRKVRIKIDGPVVEKWALGYLMDTIYLRDLWLHRVDACPRHRPDRWCSPPTTTPSSSPTSSPNGPAATGEPFAPHPDRRRRWPIRLGGRA